MIAVDRREDTTNLSQFREQEGDVRVTHIRKRQIRGVTQSVMVTGERTAGRVVSLENGWAAHVWALTPDSSGERIHTFTRLGVFPDKQQAVEAIAEAFDWRATEDRMRRCG